MQTAQTLPSNWRFKSSTSLKPTKLTPGSNGAKGWRYFACPVVARDPNVRAMKRIFQRQNPPFGFVPVVIIQRKRKSTRQFQRAFPGFGAAVAEKSFVEAGNFDQLLGQLGLIFVKK